MFIAFKKKYILTTQLIMIVTWNSEDALLFVPCLIYEHYLVLSYLDLIKNVKTRVAVSKMRISCHFLPIKSGRYKKIPRVERLCPLCNRSEIGDEFHYLLKCTHSSLSHIRGIFLESLHSVNSNFTNMSCKALFLYIISMCDENIINLTASYIENILNCYASEL